MEIIETSRSKAKTMVDVAVQVRQSHLYFCQFHVMPPSPGVLDVLNITYSGLYIFSPGVCFTRIVSYV